MKKITCLLLALILLLGILTGCSDTDVAASTTGPEGTLEEVLEGIYQVAKPAFDVMPMPVDLTDADSVKYFTGLDSTDAVAEALVSESALGAQAYSLVLVRLKDAADAASVAEEMKTGIDPRKWICVEADDLWVVAAGDVVMLIMISSEYADTITAADIVDAFAGLSSDGLTVVLK